MDIGPALPGAGPKFCSLPLTIFTTCGFGRAKGPTVPTIFRRCPVVLVVFALALASCSSDGTSVSSYNEGRKRFAPAANRDAKNVLARIAAGGVECTKTQTEDFNSLVKAYTLQKLPLPLGSASCVGPNGENLLVEVFQSDAPNARTFVDRKRDLICKKAKEFGRQPDGSSDFEGLPYVISADSTWLVEPDSFAVNRQIAKALGRPARDSCAKIK